MPTTPPKTDPALERLARRLANAYPYLTVSNECRRHDWVVMPKDLEDQVAGDILQSLAPLAEVVSSTRQLVDSVDRWESVVEQIIGRRPELHQYVELEAARRALANLDAGREE